MRDPTRVIWRRCFAYAIDVTLTALVLVGTVLITGDVHTSKGGCPDPIPHGHACIAVGANAYLMRSSVFLWFGVALAALVIVAFVIPQAIVGASLGKALLGIRVVRQSGSRPGLVRSSIRVLAYVVDSIALLLPVGLWLVLITPGHRRAGDLLAGTYVVRRADLGKAVSLPSRRMRLRRR